ncbi:MAG TPA: glycosyltransferase family 4 protein [Flavipsychrobacter sp.]|nr:glycosyltransferase family 4 protein [Flavipsychrobacter sp.]
MKVALVQDWLTELGGAEKVFTAILELYPDADIYTLASNPEALKKMGIAAEKVTNSFIQKLPFAKTQYRNYLPFFTKAIESFDLSTYDLIISSSYSVAKGVLTHSNQVHICYCHSPVRYAWDLYHTYLQDAGLKKGLKAAVVKHYLHKLRIWDIISVNRVDHFISNSHYIAKRIKKVYNRDSQTIYPPVAIDEFPLCVTKEDFYFTCSRLVPYKKIDLIVEAFSAMPDKKLIVIGDGPDYDKIKRLAASNVTLMGYQPFAVLKEHMQKAKAFVFAAEEDFGIVPVEAQACGTPVIAYGKGGCLETVKEGVTGMYFKEQTKGSIIDCVLKFDAGQCEFDPVEISKHAQTFRKERFLEDFYTFIQSRLEGAEQPDFIKDSMDQLKLRN